MENNWGVPIKPVDLAWIAGFWEGEGSINFYRVKRTRGKKLYKSNRLYATITQGDRDILKWAIKTTGVGSISKQRNNIHNPYGWNSKLIYRYNVSNKAARYLFPKLLPYIKCSARRRQVIRALKLDQERIKGRWN